MQMLEHANFLLIHAVSVLFRLLYVDNSHRPFTLCPAVISAFTSTRIQTGLHLFQPKYPSTRHISHESDCNQHHKHQKQSCLHVG